MGQANFIGHFALFGFGQFFSALVLAPSGWWARNSAEVGLLTATLPRGLRRKHDKRKGLLAHPLTRSLGSRLWDL
jgi:hypothetical protein